MPPTFSWDNFEDIAIALADKFPDRDPLTVRFTDMHKWITELPGFTGDPAASARAEGKAHPHVRSLALGRVDAADLPALRPPPAPSVCLASRVPWEGISLSVCASGDH